MFNWSKKKEQEPKLLNALNAKTQSDEYKKVAVQEELKSITVAIDKSVKQGREHCYYVAKSHVLGSTLQDAANILRGLGYKVDVSSYRSLSIYWKTT